MRPSLAFLLGLLACSGESPAPAPAPAPATPAAEEVAAPAEAPSAADAPAAPGAPAALAEIAGEWFAVADQGGELVSRDWCDADRQGIEITDAKLTFKYGQDASVESVTAALGAEGALALETLITAETKGSYTVRYAAADHQELILEGPGRDPWRLARKDALLAAGRYLRTCCAGPDGELPEEYALVADGAACPAAPTP